MATPLSYVQYIGDGTTTQFSVPFPYIKQSHVSVAVEGVDTGHTWVSGSTIEITPAPAVDAVVELRRNTPNETRLVDYTDGSAFGEKELDLANIQTFYIVQEALDIAGAQLGLQADGSYSANYRRIAVTADPVDDQDVTNKRWVTDQFNSGIDAGQARDEAYGWAEEAEDVSVTDSAGQTGYSSYHHAQKASASETAAATSETNAAASETAASTSEANAAASETAAATSETNAAASETNAASSEALAQKWAEEIEDTEVIPGEFSAFHWAQKAENWAAGVNLPTIATGDALKALKVKSDESGYELVAGLYASDLAANGGTVAEVNRTNAFEKYQVIKGNRDPKEYDYKGLTVVSELNSPATINDPIWPLELWDSSTGTAYNHYAVGIAFRLNNRGDAATSQQANRWCGILGKPQDSYGRQPGLSFWVGEPPSEKMLLDSDGALIVGNPTTPAVPVAGDVVAERMFVNTNPVLIEEATSGSASAGTVPSPGDYRGFIQYTLDNGTTVKIPYYNN